MDQIVVKTEVQNNGEILLYYVDENGDNQEGVLTTIENIENDTMQIQENTYMLESYNDLVDDTSSLQDTLEELDIWSDDDVKRLLVFYTDNKVSFVSGTTQKKHLWAVACKTMLIGKNQQSCEEKLQELKSKYSEVRGYINRGIYVKWPFLDLCHQAFHDDSSITENKKVIPSPQKTEVKVEPKISILKQQETANKDGILSIKKLNSKSPDENVEQLLNIYLKYKNIFQKEHWRRDLWDRIAEELGEEDGEYLQKKFLNHKQHYILMYMKRKQQGPSSVNWPYMELFDKIYKDDHYFLKKHFNEELIAAVAHTVPEHEWNITQKTVLAKYYFDCYEEFEDETIPKKFLWTEVGRLIDKKPETCQTRYGMLRREHIEQYLTGDYDLQRRIPMAIIFDNIILKDVKTELSKMDMYEVHKHIWKDEQLDELVQFFYDNTELFKDKECHFVCWAAIAHKLKQSISSCKHQWDELVVLYKQILDEKKEDSDLQIEWRYIELFDRIFDYGMDTDLLNGYDFQIKSKTTNHVVVKKINVKPDNLAPKKEEERMSLKVKDNSIPKTNLTEPRTDPRSTKILEYFLKNKEKLQNTNKPSAWDSLAKQIGMSSTECAHRFRILEKTYIDYVQKEIDKPRIPITWPYYALCKKVFGHRQIKNKIKQGELNVDNDWSVGDIKLLISYFSENFDDIMNNFDDVSKWAPLAKEIGKTELFCKDKFIEVRKCYRKLRTMRNKNADMKISWIYFDLFDKIYQSRDVERMDIEEENILIDGEIDPEEDYQCIIVLENGQVIVNNSEVINDPELMQQLSSITVENNDLKTNKWTKRMKKRLLVYYINYIRSNRGKEIDPKDIWLNISAEFANKTPTDCKKMFIKMKSAFKRANETVKYNSPFRSLLEKVLKLKPKFVSSKNRERVYKNVAMSPEKVDSALQYYLDHIEEFVNPKFEKKYLWTQLANHISEPVTKVYNKINYLKQAYNIETEEIDGQKTEFSGLLKEIIAREVAVKIVLDINPSPEFSDQENAFTDDETEQLMIWYLGNLDKFKNPKFNKSYLWLEASSILNKSPLVCSKKMSEIRSLYRDMVRQGGDMSGWRFFELCQKIYGTGKRSQALELEIMDC